MLQRIPLRRFAILVAVTGFALILTFVGVLARLTLQGGVTNLYQLLSWALPTLLALLLFKAWVAGRTIARPLETLAACARQVKAGNLTARVARPGGPQEIFEVAQIFNGMLDELQSMLDSRAAFVADASHELRTPLASLEGQLSTLEHLLRQPDEPVQRALHHCRREVRRMTALVEDLLTLTRAEGKEHSHSHCGLGDLVSEVVTRVAPLFPNRQIEVDDSDLNPQVMGDEESLARALQNVLGNALLYSTEAVQLDLGCDGQWAWLRVIDRGPGVTPGDLAQLGKRFFRVDHSRSRQTGGTGLGLAITRTILQRHGGQLVFESQLAQGSQVTLKIPLYHNSNHNPCPDKSESGADCGPAAWPANC